MKNIYQIAKNNNNMSLSNSITIKSKKGYLKRSKPYLVIKKSKFVV